MAPAPRPCSASADKETHREDHCRRQHGPAEPFALAELDLDNPKPDELLVRVEAVGLCHTDLAAKAMFPAGVPVVPGHEGAGNPAYCRKFQQAKRLGCTPRRHPTLTGPNGPVAGSFFGQPSFARYALTRRRNAVVVAPEVDLALAASFGCGIQTGAGAVVNVLKPGPDSSLAVFGLGGVGMAAVMAAANLGVGQIIGVDLAESRRKTALAVGATDVLPGADLDALRELTGGGATHAVDTTAVPAVIRTAAEGLATLGTLVIVGVGRDVALSSADIMGGGKTIRGSTEGDADPQTFIPQLVEWFRKRTFPMQEIVTTFPLEQINEAVARSKDGSAIKPVLVFTD